MGKTPLRAGDTEGFLRAFWDAWRDTQIEYDIRIELAMLPTNRKGVFEIQLAAWYHEPAGDARLVASYSYDFPNAMVQTLEASLYAAVVRLERLVEDWAKQMPDLGQPAVP